MGTSKHVVILLTLALSGLLAAGQDGLVTPPPKGSNTRFASCIVRITVDPAIMPLSLENIEGLLQSSGVGYKAGREVLSLSDAEYFDRRLFRVEWLNALPAQEQPTGLSRLPDETDVAYRTRVAQVREQQKALQAMRNRGMGGYAGTGLYGAPGSAQQGEGMERSATVKLCVDLPEDVPPLADEFLKAVVKNLRDSLSHAHEVYLGDLQEWLRNARDQRRAMEAALEGVADDPAAAQGVRKQLNMMVDLSALKPQMPLGDAVELLKKSVVPPLNIVVLWSNLSDYVQVKPETPVNIDGMASVRLGTALDLLVKGIPSRLGPGGPTWRIKDNVIVIGTVVALMESGESAAKPKVEADAVNLAGQRSELTRRAQALELDLAGIDARREAIGSQIAGIEKQVREKLLRDPVTQELEKLAQIHAKTTMDAEGRLIAADTPEAQEKTIRARIELANRREELRKQAGGGQLDEFNKELSRMAIDKAEKEAQRQIVRRQLDEVQRQLAQVLTFDPEAARFRTAQESLDITSGRVAELQMRLSNLQPPMVTMIGAN